MNLKALLRTFGYFSSGLFLIVFAILLINFVIKTFMLDVHFQPAPAALLQRLPGAWVVPLEYAPGCITGDYTAGLLIPSTGEIRCLSRSQKNKLAGFKDWTISPLHHYQYDGGFTEVKTGRKFDLKLNGHEMITWDYNPQWSPDDQFIMYFVKYDSFWFPVPMDFDRETIPVVMDVETGEAYRVLDGTLYEQMIYWVSDAQIKEVGL